jgi:hypothetical protein
VAVADEIDNEDLAWQNPLGPDVPGEAFQDLLVHIVSAVVCATDGRWSAGYDLLLSGLRGAEAAVGQGEAWAPEVAARYRRAVNNYCRRFLPSLE